MGFGGFDYKRSYFEQVREKERARKEKLAREKREREEIRRARARVGYTRAVSLPEPHEKAAEKRRQGSKGRALAAQQRQMWGKQEKKKATKRKARKPKVSRGKKIRRRAGKAGWRIMTLGLGK